MIQLGLAFFGLSALWMAMGKNASARKWAPLVGLCGQPFWFALGVEKDAWVLLVLACAYSVVYIRGAWLQWRPAQC